jgi:hypothetical protein
MKATLNRVSLVTEVDAPYSDPDPRHFSHPAGFETELSRVLVHEATHYWQQLSQMFLLLVADEDWERLNTFRSQGRAEEPGVLRTALHKPHAVQGFSPQDLVESASRYWDVLSVGPHNLFESELASGVELDEETRELYESAMASGLFRSPDDGFSQVTVDLAMRVGAGSYARPYTYLQDMIGEQAMPLFPLLAHWALQTPAPVTLFPRFAEYAARKVRRWQKQEGWIRRLVSRQRVIVHELTDNQMTLYWKLGGQISKLAKKEGFPLWTVGQFLDRTSLGDHPVYVWAAGWARELGRDVVKQGMADDMRSGFRGDPDDFALLAADRLLALAGGQDTRGLLNTYLGPPVHRFSDDRIWYTGVEPNQEENDRIKDTCIAIHTAWEEFRGARRGY